jgi:hypothetical protein
VSGRGDGWNVQRLAGEEVHAAKHDQRDRFAFALDERFDIAMAKRVLAASWRHGDDGFVRFKTALLHVRLDGVHVGRKAWLFNQNSEALLVGLIERRHHQVQVHREAVHHDDFAGPGPD